MKRQNCKVTETTINGTTVSGFFPSPEAAAAFLRKKAEGIRSRSTGERYSLTVTEESKGSLTVGVIDGNPEAVRYAITD